MHLPKTYPRVITPHLSYRECKEQALSRMRLADVRSGTIIHGAGDNLK